MDLAALIWPIRFTISVIQAIMLLSKYDLLVGFGGYVSASAYLAARIRKIPIVVHEANAKPGWANTLGASFAVARTAAFEEVRDHGKNWRNTEIVGMPIREEIRKVGNKSLNEIKQIRSRICLELNLESTKPIIFAFGGSLGSTAMNKALFGAKSEIISQGANLIQVVGGANPLAMPSRGFASLSYITNMSDFYAIADLVISRSGAVTCAELMATGRFALLVPLPIGNGEQSANAKSLEASKQAEICENSTFTSDWLAENILRLLALAKKHGNKLSTKPNEVSAQELLGRIVLELLVDVNK
jgi:UDP-N-acetylglucosamine--N-acetylmuramyl-(pentapeptide) pyrophosphoryl-undecaprenol N-acetylglucosamine transferase